MIINVENDNMIYVETVVAIREKVGPCKSFENFEIPFGHCL